MEKTWTNFSANPITSDATPARHQALGTSSNKFPALMGLYPRRQDLWSRGKRRPRTHGEQLLSAAETREAGKEAGGGAVGKPPCGGDIRAEAWKPWRRKRGTSWGKQVPAERIPRARSWRKHSMWSGVTWRLVGLMGSERKDAGWDSPGLSHAGPRGSWGRECCLLYTCWEAIGGWTSGASMIWLCFMRDHPGCCVHGDYGFAGRSRSISPIQSLSLSAKKKKGEGTACVWEAIFVHHGNPTQCSHDPNGKEIKRREDICLHTADTPGSPGGSVVKNPPANTGDEGSIPVPGRSSGAGNGNPLQGSCLENPKNRRAGQYSPQGQKEEDVT